MAKQFGCRWNLHHTMGALDAKPLKNGGSPCFSYKGCHSLIFMAQVDGNYRFIWVDIGANGSASDAASFNHLEMKEVIENDTIGFPAADPHFIIGSEIMLFLL